jgi:tetrapyrrole methylase family protein / MazG family protein
MENFQELKKIIDTLRGPDGCPWDKKQTHQSLLPYLYEEANEVIDSIINNDSDHLKEELGDLLLQILLHARISEEEKKFNIDDVIAGLNEKLIRRHPHVFGDKNASNADEVVILWDDIKKEEKKHKTFESILDSIPKNFTPFLRAIKLQKAANKVGFDWKNHKEVLDKVEEEIEELKEAIDKNTNIEDEFGDILFALVNLARFLKIDSEVAIAKANLRFIKRFNYIEKKISGMGKKFNDFTIDELEAFWQEAKKNLKE